MTNDDQKEAVTTATPSLIRIVDKRREEDEKETNDNTTIKQASKNGSKITPAAAMSQSQPQSPPLQAPPTMPLRRQVRPIRPNLRRQVVVAADGNPLIAPGGLNPIELANLRLPAAANAPHPPKRPAYLPARYDTFGRGAPLLGPSGAAAAGASSKPNRYSSWAQMHWRAPPVAGGGGGPEGAPFGPHPHHHHFSPAGMLVVNPMRIVNLSEHTKSRLIKIIEALKRFSEQWFSHVLLLIFLALYACFGAYIFINFEAPTEQWEKQQIIDTRQRILNESWTEAHSAKNQSDFVDSFRLKLEEYERLLNRACASGMASSSLEDQWTFWGALFYSMTVFTTIGYGHLTPITFAGRVATMIYAIFGIPILLMVLADLGKLLTRIIKFAFKKFRSLYNQLLHKKTSIRTRKMISDNTNHCIGAARGAFVRGYAHIQPYNKFPYAFAKASSLGRRFHRDAEPPAGQAEDGAEVAPLGSEQQVATTPTDQQQTTTPLEAIRPQTLSIITPEMKAALKAQGLETTDVILTPVGQTTPVSPPVTTTSLERRHPSGFEASNSPHNAHPTASHNHHTNGQHSQQQQHHHQHRPTSHRGRSQSPGLQSGGKRKSSLGNPMGTSQRRAGPSTKQPANQTVSRSSSLSSSPLVQNNADPKLSKQPTALKQEPSAEDTAKVETPGDLVDPTEPNLALGHGVYGEDELIDEDEDEIEDEFDIPVSFALFLLVTYMMFGAVVFSIYEGWNFFDSLYFVFISMSTIGFGDIVPQHPKVMIGTFIYLLFGLALTSMCINVVQEKIHATFLRAKMQIGEKMGLDLDQIMADDYYDGSTMDQCDEDDLNSMAASQTNSSLACQMWNSENGADMEGGGPDAKMADVSPHHNEGVKQSRSRDSIRQKRRLVTGLPAHSGGGSGGGHMLRRSQSKKLQRQVTPSSLSNVVSNVELPSPQPPQQNSPPPTMPAAVALKPEFEIHKMMQLVATDSKLAPAINQPVSEVSRGMCEPLKGPIDLGTVFGSSSNPNRNKLVVSRSQPSSESRMPKSLSSETGFTCDSLSGTLNNRNRSPTRPSSDGRRSSASHQQQQQQQPQPLSGRRSADSSRRSSVSQELNQLDDLITKLSHCQSANERFGPLLGIPSSRRSSRSNPPSSNNINGNNSGGSANSINQMMTKRGTSMINRPSRFQGSSSPPTSASFYHHHHHVQQQQQQQQKQPEPAITQAKVKKKTSSGGSAVPAPTIIRSNNPPITTRTLTNNSNNSTAHQDALDELETIKFSAV